MVEPPAVVTSFLRFARTHEPQLLAEVYAATRDPLLRLARRLAADAAAAEDLVHATFVLAVERAASFDPTRALLPWLHAILANEAHRLRRRAAREGTRLDESESAGAEVEPWRGVSQGEATGILRQAIALLPERDQLVLRLQLDRGLDAGEIGRQLGRPAATVRQQIARARGRLRRMLPRGLATILLSAWLNASRTQRAAAVLVAAAAAWFACAPEVVPEPPPMARATAGAEAEGVRDAGEPAVRDDAAPSRQERVAVSPPPAAAEPVAILLRVRYARDQAPAAGVFLHVRPLALPDPALHDLWLATDAHGEVTLPGDLPGPFRIRIDRAGSVVVAADVREQSLQIPDGFDLDGCAVDAGGRPLAGARVWLSAEESDTAGGDVASTDAGGRFALRSITGRRHLHVRTGEVASAMLQVGGRARERGELLVVADRPCGAVAGRVVDPLGVPIANAAVVVGMQPYGAFGASSPPIRACTDAAGRFVADGVPHGRTMVSAQAPGFAGAIVEALISAADGAPTELTLGRGSLVLGRVRDARGEPIAGARVGWFCDVDGDATGCRTAADGSYQVRVAVPQHLELWVDAGTRGQASRPLADLVEDQTARWDPVLSPPRPPLRGALRDSRGRPLAGWRVRMFAPAGRCRAPGPWHEPAVTGADGTFGFAYCEPGPQRLAVIPPELPFAVRPLAAIVPGTDAVVVVGDEQLPEARIAGWVVGADGLPARAASVLLTQPDSLARWPLAVDTSGRFVCERLPPGPYVVEVTTRDTRRLRVPVSLCARGSVDLGALQLEAAASRAPDGALGQAAKRAP